MTSEEIKKCSIDILEYVDRFCQNNNINYYLCAGTMLGAVRHQGFIPWDDDIDIMLPREDYNKLFLCFPKEERYRFLTSDNTNDFPYAYGKIVDTLTIKLESLPKKYQKIGVDIDVFPIDNFPSGIKESYKLCLEIEMIDRKMSRLFSGYGRANSILRTIIHNILVPFRFFLRDIGVTPISKYVKQMQMLSQKYNTEETGYRGIICIAHYGTKERNDKSIYDSTVKLEFEGGYYPAPQGYKTYLKNLYGNDYMQLPPLEKRISHHNYRAFWK